MDVRKIILAVLAASAGILAERISPADADYCFDFRGKRPLLLLVKQKHDIEIQTTGASDSIIDCEYYYESVQIDIDFIDKSGKPIVSFSHYYGGMGEFIGCGPNGSITFGIVPTVIEIKLPSKSVPLWTLEKTTEEMSKDLLQFKNKVIDGHIKVDSECKPSYENKYNLNFRAKITGECTADFLKKHDRSQ